MSSIFPKPFSSFILAITVIIVILFSSQLDTQPGKSPSPASSALTESTPTPYIPTPTIAPSPTPQVLGTNDQRSGPYPVTKVIDGDTVNVSIDGQQQTLRLIGINTPETVDPRRPVECFGQQASTYAKQLLSNTQVYLEADPSQSERDKYDRLLRYIWLQDGTNFNLLMIQQGYAYEYTYDLPYKYQAEFKQAQREAQDQSTGLWGASCQLTHTPTPTMTTLSNGDCQYSCTGPDRDCKDFSTHAQAQTFFQCCGFTAENDPMHLDGTQIGDGIPCESLP